MERHLGVNIPEADPLVWVTLRTGSRILLHVKINMLLSVKDFRHKDIIIQ